jgi:hypothetical protein
MKLLRLLRLTFGPFKQIAAELKILRELYEADLGSRTPPIIRVTEAPRPKDDTEVSYSEDETPKQRGFKKWFSSAEVEEEDDE